jgi:hypothetical protein
MNIIGSSSTIKSLYFKQSNMYIDSGKDLNFKLAER